MSRFLKNLIKLRDNIAVTTGEDRVTISNKSSNSSLSVLTKNYVNIKVIDNSSIKIEPVSDNFMSFAGTIYRKIENAIKDLSDGFKYQLKLSGVGFKVSMSGPFLSFSLGRSHDDVFRIPTGVRVDINSDILFTCHGFDRELITSFCAYIKSVKPVEVYKGKGITEPDVVIKLKVGKKN